MEYSILDLNNRCIEIVEIIYSPNKSISIATLEKELKQLCLAIKDKYPYYCIELQDAMGKFQKNKLHYMGCIACVLQLIKREENDNKSKKIFISHSSNDEKEVQNFVDNILQLGIGIHHDDIFCTSVESMGIKTGEDIRKHIKQNIKHCDFAFLIISENYNKSSICLNEMGAAWALDRKVMPLLLNTTFEKLAWLFTPNIASQINEDSTLNMLYDELTEKYSIRKNVVKWGKYKTDFLNKLTDNTL